MEVAPDTPDSSDRPDTAIFPVTCPVCEAAYPDPDRLVEEYNLLQILAMAALQVWACPRCDTVLSPEEGSS